mmetsp:Transcript_20561/g.47138  ORF Transcript_20561/g.47138 Transcript_20561/m.47138 type:complete len:211 (-) Transcript_20561:1941-2573(-)
MRTVLRRASSSVAFSSTRASSSWSLRSSSARRCCKAFNLSLPRSSTISCQWRCLLAFSSKATFLAACQALLRTVNARSRSKSAPSQSPLHASMMAARCSVCCMSSSSNSFCVSLSTAASRICPRNLSTASKADFSASQVRRASSCFKFPISFLRSAASVSILPQAPRHILACSSLTSSIAVAPVCSNLCSSTSSASSLSSLIFRKLFTAS